MNPASYQSSSDRPRALLGRRATAFLLALAIDILIVIALVWLAPALPERKKPDERPTIFQTLPEPKPTPAERDRVVVERKRPSGGAPRPAPPTPKPPAGPETPPSWLVSKDEYAASDISKIPSRGAVASGDGAGSGKDSGTAYGPGEGPGGESLYNAEWQREPTRAELATYLPANMQTGWALIACQTVPGNRVENCRALDESPKGSGLARGLRLAAWQFRVLPPRIGGKPVIGAWVRIRFDLVIGITK